MYARRNSSEGVFVFETELPGVYSFELSNSFGSAARVTFVMGQGINGSLASQTDVDVLATKSQNLLNVLKSVTHENALLFTRQQEHLQVIDIN